MNSNIEKKIKLALLDDHQIVIDGLKLLLKDQDRFVVVLESTNSDDFVERLQQLDIDLVITDIILPKQKSGTEVSRIIKNKFPKIRILALSMNEDSKVVHELIEEIQIEGFLSKATGRNELIQAIENITSGGTYYSKEAMELLKYFSRIADETNRLRLSAREIEIAQCIKQRMSNKQIAEALFISERTVETHRKNIYRKTETKGEAALIEFLSGNGIL